MCCYSVEAIRSRRTPKGQAGDPTFSLFPSEVTLPPNGTARMHLWCLPKYEGEVADKLILSVSDNHQPLEVKLLSRCIAPKICLQTDSVAFGRILAGHIAKRLVIWRKREHISILGQNATSPNALFLVPVTHEQATKISFVRAHKYHPDYEIHESLKPIQDLRRRT